MGQSVAAIEAKGKKFGILLLPPDHPEFTSGPQVHFVNLKFSQSKRKASGSATPAGKKSKTSAQRSNIS